MNKFFFLFSLFLIAFATPDIQAQNEGQVLDTISTSGSIDTVDIYPVGTTVATSKLFKHVGPLRLITVADSLSGSTGATAYLQYGYGSTPATWFNYTSWTIDGVTTQNITTDEFFGLNRWRLRIISANGTQSTAVRTVWRFER